MKKLSLFLVVSIFMAILIKPVLSEEAQYSFKISAYFLEEGRKTEWGSVSFITSEKKYVLTSFTFYKDFKRCMISGSGEGVTPVTHLLNETGLDASASEIFLTTDLYLRASPTKDKLIRLKGVLIKLTQAENTNSPLFDYSEKKLDFILPKNGIQTLPLSENYNGKQIYLDISVQVQGEPIYQEKISRTVTFKTEYYLYNQETKKYELEGKGAVLGVTLDADIGEATGYLNKVFKLSSGDSLLYTIAYEIKNVSGSGSDKIKFKLEVSHIYALNPILGKSKPEEPKSEKTTVVLFNKDITVTIGERTEIEIPQDKESLLPFKSKETLVLINSVKEEGLK